MNVYLIPEDDISFCIKAKTMSEALKICESSYLEEQKDYKKEECDENEEKEYYNERIIQNCALIDQLKN